MIVAQVANAIRLDEHLLKVFDRNSLAVMPSL